jgi:hypothetical protein
MKIKFSTILIIAAVAAAIWYFTKEKKQTQDEQNGITPVGTDPYSTYGPGNTPVTPIMQQPVIKPALKKPVIKPVVRPTTAIQVPVLAELTQSFFGRA